MREIKFRQAQFNKDGSFREWHYWGFIEQYGGITFVGPISPPEPAQALKDSYQFTGLMAKNKEIYESDILSCKELWVHKENESLLEENDVRAQVAFKGYEWAAYGRVIDVNHETINYIYLKFSDYREGMSWGNGIENFNNDFHARTRWVDFEVIGNIYENPELLKEGK